MNESRKMLLRIEFDTKAIEVEGNSLEEVVDLANQALFGLWGRSARFLNAMTLEQADEWLNQTR